MWLCGYVVSGAGCRIIRTEIWKLKMMFTVENIFLKTKNNDDDNNNNNNNKKDNTFWKAGESVLCSDKTWHFIQTYIIM
jgi:hypothetical protein